MQKSKILALFALIFLSALFPIFFVNYAFYFEEAEFILLAAKLTAVIGTALLFWQGLLGVRQFTRLIDDNLMWFLNLHKILGKWGSSLILLHPVLLLFHFSLQGRNLLQFGFMTERETALTLGYIAAFIILINLFTSVFIREKLSFPVWKNLHLLGYFIFPLGIFHALELGSLTTGEEIVYNYWIILLTIYIVIVSYRLLSYIGLFVPTYKITASQKVAENAVEIKFTPVSGGIDIPQVGQFVYIRHNFAGEAHPYSVTGFDQKNRTITLVIKNLGDHSESMQFMKEGEKFYIDGPYGTFLQSTQDADKKAHLVFLAGGVGITPFLYFIEHELTNFTGNVTLFYGSNYKKDIIQEERLNKLDQSLDNFQVIHVLAEEKDYEGETGFITIDLLKKYLQQDLENYNFFICGPPVMINILVEALENAGIEKDDIEFELFGY